MQPEDLTWDNGRAPFANGAVRVRWLGTAGFAIEHDGHVLLIDPYLTRPSLRRCLLGGLRADEALLAAELPRADAIILGHTHFDHALDAPALARRTGARVLGSRSAIALCAAAGLPAAQLTCVEPEPGGPAREAEVGPFALRFWPSAHSRLLLGRVPWPGDIADCDQVPGRVSGFRCGAVFGVDLTVGGRRIYHMGSAELVEGSLAGRARGVDLALLCVAGWTTTERYPERAIAALSPGAVLLHHWDNFLRPFAAPARPFPAMRIERLVDRLHAASPALPVGTLPIGGAVGV